MVWEEVGRGKSFFFWGGGRGNFFLVERRGVGAFGEEVWEFWDFWVQGPACSDVCPLLRAPLQEWMPPAQLPHHIDIEMKHA